MSTETKINQNQIVDGESSRITVINVIQGGTLNLKGPVIKGFSSSNYINMSSRVLFSYLYLANNAFCPAELIKTADSWEMFCKVTPYSDSSDASKVLWQENRLGSYCLCTLKDNSITISLALGNSSWGDLVPLKTIAIPNITENKKECYIRFGFTGTKYYIEASLDKDIWDGSYREEHITSTKFTVDATEWRFGGHIYNNEGPFIGSFDLTDWRFTLNGEVIWKGIETL